MRRSIIRSTLMFGGVLAFTYGIGFGQDPSTAKVDATGTAETFNAISAETKLKFDQKKTKAKLQDENPADNAAAEAQQQSGDNEAAELAKKLSNPVAAMISVPLQYNYDHGMGPTGEGARHTLNVQPVIPFKINPKWNLISRTILPVIHQSKVTSPINSQTGLGDVVQSFFFSPNKSEPFIWGAGPVVLIPTATNDSLATKQLGLGATFLILKQSKGWTVGMLWNHIWRVAGGSGRPRVNSDFIQPIISYGTKSAWTFGFNTESTYDWTANHWSVPMHFSASKLVRFGKQPVSLGATLRCWATSPAGGPEGCGPRFVITFLYPSK